MKTTRFHSLQKPHRIPKAKKTHLFTNFFLDEMLESENSSMAERLYDLERQVLEQQEEILSLKSTLSEVLRRLNNLDCNSSRISSSTSSSSSYETTIKNNRSEYEKLLSRKGFNYHISLTVSRFYEAFDDDWQLTIFSSSAFWPTISRAQRRLLMMTVDEFRLHYSLYQVALYTFCSKVLTWVIHFSFKAWVSLNL